MTFIAFPLPISLRRALICTLACMAIVVTLLPVRATAQTIVLQDVDPSGFPTIRARFRALDRDMNPIVGLTPSDLTVTENGISRPVLEVTECTETRVVPLTVGIMVDTKYHIELARAGTKRLAGFLRMPSSEIGITTMDAGVYVVQDLTKNREKVLAKADALGPAPGVDLQRMFYDPQAGGVPFVAGRPNRKALILITDLHCPMLNLDTARLFADAARENIAVYSVLLHAGDYTGLFRTIAQRTGGELFEKVTTEEQINDIFLRIGLEQYGVPCAIAWESAPECRVERNATVSLPKHGASGSISYTTSLLLMPRLDVDRLAIFFGRMGSGTKDEMVTITARGGDMRVTAAGIDNPRFTVADYGGSPPPFTIARDASRTLTVRFAPTDSAYNFGTFELTTDLCPQQIYVAGGFPGRGTTPTLKLTRPNGGEEFLVGTDTVITWQGTLPDDKVRLEYSIDAGTTWGIITEEATGHSYGWRAPNTPSRRCLARVTQLTAGEEDSLLFIAAPTGNKRSLVWSPHGNELAITYNGDTALAIFDAVTGHPTFLRMRAAWNIDDLLWSSDGKYLVESANNGMVHTVRVWDRQTGTFRFELPHDDDGIYSTGDDVKHLDISPDGKILATMTQDGFLRLWDLATGARVSKTNIGSSQDMSWNSRGDRIVTAHGLDAKVWSMPGVTLVATLRDTVSRAVSRAVWNPAGDRVAGYRESANMEVVTVWDAASGAIIMQTVPRTNADDVTNVRWSPDGASLAGLTELGYLVVWDAATGLERYRRDFNALLEDFGWSPDGRWIALTWTKTGPLFDNINRIYLLDAATGATVSSVEVPEDLKTLRWSSDATQIAARGYDALVVWTIINKGLQSDLSDSLWAIIAPEPELKVTDVDMGTVRVGRGKDSLVAGVLCNRGGAPLHVLGMDVTGGDVADFMIPSGAGDFTLAPGECRAITVEFMPTRTGSLRATVTVRMKGSTFADTIALRGVGVEPVLRVESADIDFGAIRVGERKDTTVAVVLRNVGGAQVAITDVVQGGPDIPSFTLVSGGGAFTLDPGETRAMELRFTPGSVGRTTGRIAFEHAESGSPEIVRLVGRGLGGIVYLPDDSAAAGERFPLALMIDPQGPRTGPATGPGGEQRFRARISVDQTVLAPDDAVQPGVTDNGIRTFTVEGVWDGASDTLARIPMLALLGNVEESSLELLSFDWLDASARPLSIESETRSGRFTLLDLCREGEGTRLYDQHGVAAALKVLPNPVADAFELEYDLAEDGRIAIDLYDLVGVKVRSILDADRPAGSYRMKLSARQLPAGAYLLTLRTPTQLLSRRVEVRK